ncbi:MAG: hypothetical protein OSB41_06830 [Kiritimatiellae bacterium]|nr:hypothetical protein [Kiritimatiellia bacterium]
MSDESEKKQDDAPESTDAKTPATNPPAQKGQQKDVTVVKDGHVTVQPALLEEAVTQLKKLSEMRQQELVRQDNAIAEMQATVQSQARQNRTLFNSIGALICILILLVSFSIQALKSEQESTTKEVQSVVTRLSTTANMIRQVSVKQSDQTAALKSDLSDSFSDATSSINAKLNDSVSQVDKSMSKLDGTVGKVSKAVEVSVAKIESTLQATTGDLVTKMDARSSDMTKTLNSSVDAMRGERDIVKAEVQKAMNAHREHIVERELALSKQAANVAKQEEQTRKERIRIIDEAIQRLSSMANTLKTPEDLAKEKAAAQKAINAAVKKAKAEEAKKAQAGKNASKATAANKPKVKKKKAKGKHAPTKKDAPATETDAKKVPNAEAPAKTKASAKTAG